MRHIMHIFLNLFLLSAIFPKLVTSSPVPTAHIAVRAQPVQAIHSLDNNMASRFTPRLGTRSRAEETEGDSNNKKDSDENSNDEAIYPDSSGSQAALGDEPAVPSGSKGAKLHVSSSLTAAAPPAPAAAFSSTPRFAIYASDSVPRASNLQVSIVWSRDQKPSCLILFSGVFNTLILAFLCGDADGPRTNGTGVTQTWAGMTADQRQEYKAAGITILVSLFGWTAKPTSSKWDSTATANMMADWVMANGVDGIDVDYEGTVAMDAGLAEAWVASFTTQLRNRLPSPTYILTHAPMALWWSGTQLGGGYRTIDQTVGGMIDWYNVQFYNAGQQYVNCTSLVQENPDQTALLQINTEGKVPLNKLVLGKPATNGDGGSYTDITTLNSCIQTAKAAQWDAGIMFWKYGDNATEVMTLARKGVFP